MIRHKTIWKRSFAILVLLGLLLPLHAYSQERLAVQKPTVHVRSGPGTNFPTLWDAEMNYPVQVLEKKNNWVRFRDFEGYEGWISSPLLAKSDTVVVKRGQVNVRSGPGTNHEVAFIVEKGVPFRVVTRKGDWIQIKHADGDTGWIKKDLVW